MKKNTVYIIVAIIGLVIGYLISNYTHHEEEIHQKEQAVLMLEKVKKVFKIIAVEGQVSEIFDHKEYWAYDLSPFRKKMLIRAIAKVSVGYDMDSLTIDIDEKSKTLIIGPFPKAQILSIDHDIDYYDVSEGLFNTFQPKDYNKVQKKVKDLIEEKASEGFLFEKAEKQKQSLINTLEEMIRIYGWQIKIKENQELLN